MDLEMPGPSRWRTPLLVGHMLSCQKVLDVTLDERATNILNFVQRLARRNPEVVFGDGVERSRDSPEARAFARRLAADGMVVLKNDANVLPLKAGTIKKIALIGPNVKERVISGGGSAALKATYIVNPYAGLVENAPEGVEIKYTIGCYGKYQVVSIATIGLSHIRAAAYKYTPTLEAFLTTPSGEPGWLCSFYKHDESGNPIGDSVMDYVLQDTRVKLNDFLPVGLTPTWTIKLRGSLTMDKTGEYQLGLTVAGRAKLYVNGELTIDNWTTQRPGDFFYGSVYSPCFSTLWSGYLLIVLQRQGTVEEMGTISLTAGKPVDILVEYTNTKPPNGPEADRSQPALMRGVVRSHFFTLTL